MIARPAGPDDADELIRLRAVLLTSDFEKLRESADSLGWECSRKVRVIVLGQPARISVWRKPPGQDTMNV